jgi:hypothetical protein
MVVVLASLLAQVQPSPEASPPLPSHPPLVHRGPQTTPRVVPGDITIRNTGSTNFGGYTIVVHASGAADVTVDGETQPKTLPAPQTKWLFQKVLASTPLDTMPSAGCMKSASFGAVTTVSYGGTTSPDISCPADATMREIARTVGVVTARLGVRPQPRHALPKP